MKITLKMVLDGVLEKLQANGKEPTHAPFILREVANVDIEDPARRQELCAEIAAGLSRFDLRQHAARGPMHGLLQQRDETTGLLVIGWGMPPLPDSLNPAMPYWHITRGWRR